MNVNIQIINQQRSLKICKDQIQAIVTQVLLEENCQCDEIAIHFVSKKKICELHAEYFDDPSLTDCITFPIDEEEDSCYRMLGEIFVCPYTALQYAKDHQKDPLEELTLYIIHGILHLLGYDDIKTSDRKLMRQAEAKHIKNLKARQLHLSSSS